MSFSCRHLPNERPGVWLETKERPRKRETLLFCFSCIMALMATTKIIFLRHADTQKDPAVHASQWGLSPAGSEAAERLAVDATLMAAQAIYVSEEPKTALTAGPLASALGIEPVADAAFNEVARGEKFLSKEDFEAEKKRQLEDLEYAAFNGETGREALARFKEGVERAVAAHPGKTVLITTHGTVLNLYFADLLGKNAELPERWNKTAFCAYGVVEDGSVTKDIV